MNKPEIGRLRVPMWSRKSPASGGVPGQRGSSPDGSVASSTSITSRLRRGRNAATKNPPAEPPIPVNTNNPSSSDTAEPTGADVASSSAMNTNSRSKKKPASSLSGMNSVLTNGSSGKPTGSLLEAANNIYRVTIPDNVVPGQEFTVIVGTRIVRVKCPVGSKPGDSLQITVPNDPVPGASNETNGGSHEKLQQQYAGQQQQGPLHDSPGVKRIETGNPNAPPAYMVTIPDGVHSGEQFSVTIQGQQLMITCPPNARTGSRVRIVPPLPPQGPSGADRPQELPMNSKSSGGSTLPEEDTKLFEVTVPPGVQPGRPFALLAGGVRVLVTCPTNASPGQRIRFRLPLALTHKTKPQNEAAAIKLSYDKDGWTRTVRVSDMRFQWVRMDDNSEVDTITRFDLDKSAYVRKLDFDNGSDDRVRNGVLSLVPAQEATCDSKVKGNHGDVIASYVEIATAQGKSYIDKVTWFQEKCDLLGVEWNIGHMRMNVRRDFLLEDSVDAVMSLNRRDLRKSWRFVFLGEDAIDAGGVKREWFHLVTKDIFDPDMGLWMSSETNQMCMQINPASKFVSDDYLVYYRFLGRVMGKALFDRELVVGHMVQYLYKHMLGFPITFKDIESIDEELYSNLKQLRQLVEQGCDLRDMTLTFSTTQDVMGVKEEVELVEGGMNIELTNDNFPEYLEACLTYRMMERVKPQLKELLLGFFDVIPEPLLTVFDFQELELLMCGLPTIDLDDWMANTEYTGIYEFDGVSNPACQWFWEVVEEFDHENRARLLQFVTGTSGVPSQGFGVLQGIDGNIRRFTIHGVTMEYFYYPRAHTCFNRIDLPQYASKDDLRDKLKLAVTMASTGFDIE